MQRPTADFLLTVADFGGYRWGVRWMGNATKAILQITGFPDHVAAAVNGLRAAADVEFVGRGTFIRVWLRLVGGDTAGSREGSDEACEIAERGPMPLFLADNRAKGLDMILAHYPKRDVPLENLLILDNEAGDRTAEPIPASQGDPLPGGA